MHINQDHKISQRQKTFEVKEIPSFQTTNLPLHFFRCQVFWRFLFSSEVFFDSVTPFPLFPFVFTSKLCSPVKHRSWQETSWISCPGRSSWWRISWRSALRTWETSPPLLTVRYKLGGFLLKRLCLGTCACWSHRCAELTITAGDATVVRLAHSHQQM